MAISLQLETGDSAKSGHLFSHLGRSWDKENDVPAVRLQPGDFYVTTVSEMITTVLGSCISACIFDLENRVGGMNHFMLPMAGEHNSESWDVSNATLANRFGNFAMENLINEILKAGGRREHLRVKLFGGGRVLKLALDVSDRNIKFAESYIRSEGFNLLAKDLGGTCPRKVNFFPIGGKAFVKRLSDHYVGKLEEIEKGYSNEISTKKDTSGSLEFF